MNLLSFTVPLPIVERNVLFPNYFSIDPLVLQGMLSSRGSRLLFADADGATKIEDLAKLEDALQKDAPDEVAYLDVSVLFPENQYCFSCLGCCSCIYWLTSPPPR